MDDDERLDAFCRELRQGDVLGLRQIYVGSELVECPDDVIIISQTCDLVRPKDRPNIVVAKAVRLNSAAAKDALRGKRPRWVAVDEKVDGLFADLEMVSSISKSAAVELSVERSIADEHWSAQRRFAQRVGRRFSRLALPDNIVPWFGGLSDLVLSKAGKPNSPLGRAIEMIAEIRVAADDWTRDGASVELYIVLEPGELPLLSDEPAEWNPAEADDLSASTIAGVAERLFPDKAPRPTGEQRNALWWQLAELLGAIVVPTGPLSQLPAVRNAIKAVAVSIVDETEFTMAQYRRSDELDLSHLSPPLPRNNDGGAGEQEA
ncbi:MAG: hypothetical protein BGN98_04765 [Microbacterium sp. 69-7]|uniref:hypothetical protein n=1 Tax=Microbacterium sp. 69-7 TaxID=1895784 RepID=UPI0009633E07|nr:hypothetical protein [Microbacterium sp. 69-7]OJU47783.1 MAG: hypothetical protein BGN98_04765 [Microbacterium sp. 69-7]